MTGRILRTSADDILEQGIERGQNDTAALFGFLLSHGRNEDAQRACSDQAFFKELLAKFRSGSLA